MLLNIQNLKKRFGSHEVLQGIDLNIEPGQIVGLLGPNGTGKSTLIKCINDLLIPDAGTITIEDQPSSPESRQAISYLPEKTYLNPAWKASQALDFFETFYADFDRKKAETMLLDLGLDSGMEIKSMSKGMQEKLQLALVMSRKAKLYILDEPLGGVDPASRDKILDTILSNFEEGSSMLISTHLISDIERILDRAVFMREGRIFLDEEAESLRARTGHSVDETFREAFR